MSLTRTAWLSVSNCAAASPFRVVALTEDRRTRGGAAKLPSVWAMKPAACCCTVEITCADMLAELNETLRVASIEHPFRDKMKRFELFSRLGEENFFPTMSAAVSRSLATHPVEWEDWEDRRP